MIDEDDRLSLTIYYKNKKTNQLITKNNSARKEDYLHQTNVLYEFSCPQKNCRLLQTEKYIEMTSTTLSRRMTMHKKLGAIEKDMRESHNITLTRQIMENNINMIKRCPDRLRLAIAEALHLRTSSDDQSTGQYFCKDIEII